MLASLARVAGIKSSSPACSGSPGSSG